VKLRRPTLFEIEAGLLGSTVAAAAIVTLVDYGTWIWRLLR
jgi:hypothetical protein